MLVRPPFHVFFAKGSLQKKRGGLTSMEFGVWGNQIVPSKKVENNIFLSAALPGANIFHLLNHQKYLECAFKIYIQLVL